MRRTTGIGKAIAFALLAALGAGQGCGVDDCDDYGCDPQGCASLEAGEWQVSGDPRIDTVFRATAATLELDRRLRDNEAATREAVARLAEAFDVGIDPDGDLEENAAELADAMQGVFADAVAWSAWSAGPAVADVRLAVATQVECLTHFQCDVDTACLPVAAGQAAPAPVECEGQCLGACDGTCDGECLLPVGDETCDGDCHGVCEFIEPEPCEGTCHGECVGTCYVANGATGECMGPCQGNCTGYCETLHGAACSGSCTGDCADPDASGACAGECRGACTGLCDGDCAGLPQPSECAGEACAEREDCRSMAAVMGGVGSAATWTEYLVVWDDSVAHEGWTAAQVDLAFAVLEEQAPALIERSVELEALFDGGGGVSAMQGVTAAVESMLEEGLESYDIPQCRTSCVVPAFEDSADLLVDFSTRVLPLASAQSEILSAIGF